MTGKRCFGCMNIKYSTPVCEHCGYNEYAGNERHQLPCGTVLRGQYVVGKVLGQGGFGITYLGWDQYMGGPVAIKEFFPTGFANRDCAYSLALTAYENLYGDFIRKTRERFIREAQTLGTLAGVSEVVQVRSYFEENNTAYIIMEYVRGVDLGQYIRLRGGRLTAQETLTVMEPMMRALIQVHEAGLVHRDISPDNIMMLHGGGIKLLDFGAVRRVDVSDPGMSLPKSTEAILKRGFAPIEQYQTRGSLGPWTDEYALCATMYYCMTGRLPTDAPERIMEDHVDFHSIPGLQHHQAAALGRGMALRASDRFPSIRELAQALYQTPAIRQEEVKVVSQPEVLVSMEQEEEVRQQAETKTDTKRFNPLIIAAAAAVVCGVLIFGRTEKPKAPEGGTQLKPTESVSMETQRPDAPVDSQGESGVGEPYSETVDLSDPLVQAEVGDYVFFGQYPQDGDGTERPIEWLVLEKQDDGILVISRYGLDCVKYDEQSNWTPSPVRWEDCSLNRWLNNDFFNRAFTLEEQQRLDYMSIGEDVNKVFVLSKREVEWYLPTEESRQCRATDYSQRMGSSAMAASGGCSWWWLRSAGADAQVPDVDSDGTLSTARVNGEKATVRPVIWIGY